MKKSIGDNIFPKGMSFEEGLQLLQKSGYEGVELWLGERDWFKMTATDRDFAQLNRKIRDAGLAVSDVANSLDWDENVSSRDPAKRAAAFRHIERQMEAAQLFGCKSILIVAGLVTSEEPYNEVYGRTVDALRELGAKAAKAQVKIGVENCCAEQRFLMSPREFAGFLRDINSPAVGIHLDVGNIHETGFAEQWIEILGRQITCIHVKDTLKHRGRCGEQSVYTNIFLGDNNWRAIRDALTKVQYDSWLVAEMEARYKYAPDQQFFDTAAALNRLIAGRV